MEMAVALFDLLKENETIKYDEDIHKIFIAKNSLMTDNDTFAVYDLAMAFVLGYFLVTLLPTFMNNLVITLKEATMKQSAWSLEEDYKEGEAMGISTDFLYWFGVSEDDEYYQEYIKEFMHEYI